MKKGFGIQKVSIVIGCILIVCSLILLICWQITVSDAAKKSSYYVEFLRTVLSEPEPAVPEEKSSNEMPVLCVDGVDFTGIMELPKYDSVLPVCANWNGKLMYPSCYAGSVYDGSMIIGASSQRGQFDFYREIGVGDAIYFTDMTCNRYAYEVTNILYREHADSDALEYCDSDLTLFIKKLYAFEYVIIYCKALTC